MEKFNLDKNDLRKFGITMGVSFLIVVLLLTIRHKPNLLPLFSISIIFFISAFMLPALLKPIYILWMRLAFILGWINTRLILSILFYLVFTPIGLVMRLFRVDLLDRKIDKNKNSYWHKMPKRTFNQLSYEKQF